MVHQPPKLSTDEEVQRLLRAQERAETAERHESADRGQRRADQVANKVHEVVDEARSGAHKNIGAVDAPPLPEQNTTQAARDKVKAAGTQAQERADAAMTASGQRLTGLANTVRDRAPEGKAGQIANRAANALEQSGTYLQNAQLNDVRHDLENTIRNRPVESLLVGMGIGFLLARTTRRR